MLLGSRWRVEEEPVPNRYIIYILLPSMVQVLSGTIVRMIEKVQRDLATMGKPLDLELECYAALAARMDAFIDIFNGKLTSSLL